MTSKPETVIREIHELDNKQHSESFQQFYDWLIEDEDSSVRNATNYLMILRLFSVEISDKSLQDVARQDVVHFLDKRKKSQESDPDKKWIRTWNDYLNRLIGFYRWYTNHESLKDREDWDTPKPFSTIKKKKSKRDSSYTPNDVWTVDELLLAVKYCDNIRDKVILTVGWDMVSRNDIKRYRVILDEKLKKKDDAGIEKYERIVRNQTVILIDLLDRFDALEMAPPTEVLLEKEIEVRIAAKMGVNHASSV